MSMDKGYGFCTQCGAARTSERSEDKSYVISVSGYMGDMPDIFGRIEKSVKPILLDLFMEDYKEYDSMGDFFDDYGFDYEEISEKDLIEKIEISDTNGDGRPYFMIYCVDDDECLLG